jgi:hypothetical protein
MMHRPRLIRKPVADILGVFFDMATDLRHPLTHGVRPGSSLIQSGLFGDGRRHGSLLDAFRVAGRAREQTFARLLVVGRTVAKPAFKAVTLLANELIANHVATIVPVTAGPYRRALKMKACADGRKPPQWHARRVNIA